MENADNNKSIINGCVCDFQAAKRLYTFVLQDIQTLFDCGVNKLCQVAIFNNVSHLCKSLAAGSSHHVLPILTKPMRMTYFCYRSETHLLTHSL